MKYNRRPLSCIVHDKNPLIPYLYGVTKVLNGIFLYLVHDLVIGFLGHHFLLSFGNVHEPPATRHWYPRAKDVKRKKKEKRNCSFKTLLHFE